MIREEKREEIKYLLYEWQLWQSRNGEWLPCNIVIWKEYYYLYLIVSHPFPLRGMFGDIIVSGAHKKWWRKNWIYWTEIGLPSRHFRMKLGDPSTTIMIPRRDTWT